MKAFFLDLLWTLCARYQQSFLWRCHVLYCSDAPDTSGMNRAAESNAAVAQQALDWYTAEYARTQPARDAAEARAAQVSDAQLAQSKLASDQAADQANYAKDVFRPLEQRLVSEAGNYDTQERRDAAAGAAAADVTQAYKGAAEKTARSMARYGVDPSSGAGASAIEAAGLDEARAKAGAMTAATRNVEQQGYARMMDAAGLGRNVVSNQATYLTASQNAGNSSVANQTQALNAQASGAGLMQSGFSTAVQGNQSAGSLYGQAANVQQNASNGTMQGLVGIGSLIAMSDEDVKSDKKPANTARMLGMVEKTPVSEWRYDPEKGGPDDGGQQHVGPMAQDVNEQMGEQAAPGGKVIDLVSANGVTMGAVQELSKRVRKLEQHKGARA